MELIFQLYNNAIKAKNESLGFEEDETVRQNEETLKADPPKTRKKRSRSVEYKTRNTIDDEDFKTKLDRFIINSAIDKRVLSKSDLMRITRGWKNGRDEKTDDEWYDYYYKELYSQPGWSKPLKTTYENIKYTVYKTPNKRKKLAFDMVQKTTDKKTNLQIEAAEHKRVENEKKADTYIPNSFPLKDNKKYYLHSVFSPNTYIIDLMFSDKNCYLIAINGNTRYLYAQILNTVIQQEEGFRIGTNAVRNVSHYIAALDKLLKQGMKPEKLIGDDEGCFKAATAFYNQHHIIFEPVRRMRKGVYPNFMPREQNEKTEPLHSSLGLVDRVIRTLRDMAYNVNIGTINPGQMKDLVMLYNKAPHETLSYYAGEETTPEMAQNDPELENFIIRRIMQSNFNVKKQFGYDLPENSPVSVYNDTDIFQKRRTINQPGHFVVGKFDRGLYEVKNVEGNVPTQYLPRYRLQPEHQKKYVFFNENNNDDDE